VTYSLADFLSYRARESKPQSNYLDAFAAARGCDQTTPSCQARRAQRDQIKDSYDANEQDAAGTAALWLGAGIGGALLMASGVVLLFASPSLKPKEPAADHKGPPSQTLHVVPTVSAREQGLSIVGRF
jgi:hypothetical protein